MASIEFNLKTGAGDLLYSKTITGAQATKFKDWLDYQYMNYTDENGVPSVRTDQEIWDAWAEGQINAIKNSVVHRLRSAAAQAAHDGVEDF